MKPRAGQATRVIDAPPDRVFTVIKDVRRPGAADTLAEGAEWTVGTRFPRRFHVIEHDPAERRLAYRVKLEGENPSFAIFTWQVDPKEKGALVTLAWELRPVTFVRKRVTSPILHRLIARRNAPRLLDEIARRSST